LGESAAVIAGNLPPGDYPCVPSPKEISAIRSWARTSIPVKSWCGTPGNQFITAAYVFVDTARRELCYDGAGHPPVLLWRPAANQVEDLEENGLFLGPFPHAQYATRRWPFEPVDRCLLYTDGLVEAANAKDEEFGAPRRRDFLSRSAGVSADFTCTALLDQVTAWFGGELDSQQDDITFVLVEFRP
jgi:phosphoserine phosphatase RsbU/P